MSKNTAPRRVQRRRTKGWRMPENSVYVGRGTKWGNPFRIGGFYWDRTGFHRCPSPCVAGEPPMFMRWTQTIARERIAIHVNPVRDNHHAVELFRRYIAYNDDIWTPEVLSHLAGKNLACWCPLTDAQGNHVPCHADVLLELANGGAER